MYFAGRDVLSAKVIVEQLGGRLKQARLNQNITQEAIADRIGVNRRTIASGSARGFYAFDAVLFTQRRRA